VTLPVPLVHRKLEISSLQIFAADKYKKLSFSENRYLQGSSHTFYLGHKGEDQKQADY
jgi:hypothetical protein